MQLFYLQGFRSLFVSENLVTFGGLLSFGTSMAMSDWFEKGGIYSERKQI